MGSLRRAWLSLYSSGSCSACLSAHQGWQGNEKLCFLSYLLPEVSYRSQWILKTRASLMFESMFLTPLRIVPDTPIWGVGFSTLISPRRAHFNIVNNVIHNPVWYTRPTLVYPFPDCHPASGLHTYFLFCFVFHTYFGPSHDNLNIGLQIPELFTQVERSVKAGAMFYTSTVPKAPCLLPNTK